jgi:hypothetical protein
MPRTLVGLYCAVVVRFDPLVSMRTTCLPETQAVPAHMVGRTEPWFSGRTSQSPLVCGGSGHGQAAALTEPLLRSATIRIVRTTVVAVRHAVAVAVPACMVVVSTAVVPMVRAMVMTGVMAVRSDVTGRRRRNHNHVRAQASVSMVRLRLRGGTQGGQCDHGRSAECVKHLLHGSSFEELFRSSNTAGQM